MNKEEEMEMVTLWAVCIIEAAIIAALMYACKVLWDGWQNASADIKPIEWSKWDD